jgi:hypothetical protein
MELAASRFSLQLFDDVTTIMTERLSIKHFHDFAIRHFGILDAKIS